MIDKVDTEMAVQLTDSQIDDVSGGFVPVAFYVAAVFLGSANLGYQVGRDVANRGRR